LRLTVGPVGAGGICVARTEEGQVVMVRHALPGEVVEAVVTESHRSFLRADAVEILAPASDRVVPPCPYAGPGRCGGCDWQHVSLPGQRLLKAEVVAEQLRRLAGLDLPVTVEEVPGPPGGLGWRTRVRYSVDQAGRAGFRRHRSHDVQPVERCLIASDGVDAEGVTRRRWPGVESVEVPGPAEHTVRGRLFRSGPGAFWQVHPAAAEVLVGAVMDGLAPGAGERALDLYGGAGIFAAFLAEAVGPSGDVLLVEGSGRAAADARANLAPEPWARVRRAAVAPELLDDLGPVDVVVLDPPRAGAGRALSRSLATGGARALAYVACDPAALARDLAVFVEHGWVVSSLRAFDLFPMTQHVEVVAVLVPG
jgi:tRNA/tmRNA/rRNA uracil-C5-methylase (TrmA/RlmC/RlmD family)